MNAAGVRAVKPGTPQFLFVVRLPRDLEFLCF